VEPADGVGLEQRRVGRSKFGQLGSRQRQSVPSFGGRPSGGSSGFRIKLVRFGEAGAEDGGGSSGAEAVDYLLATGNDPEGAEPAPPAVEFGLGLALATGNLGAGERRPMELVVRVHPVVRRQGVFFDQFAGGFEVVERLVDRRVLGVPRFEQLVDLLLERFADPVELGQARPGGEEHLAEPTAPPDDQLPPSDKLGVVGREQIHERRLVKAAEQRGQGVSG